ncbi:hypothetical protein CRUP_016488 [Coryphaenoides rupestris]|nr:hypothetical protein CRUP_016488 [Coryphaenoides rupestris]
MHGLLDGVLAHGAHGRRRDVVVHVALGALVRHGLGGVGAVLHLEGVEVQVVGAGRHVLHPLAPLQHEDEEAGAEAHREDEDDEEAQDQHRQRHLGVQLRRVQAEAAEVDAAEGAEEEEEEEEEEDEAEGGASVPGLSEVGRPVGGCCCGVGSVSLGSGQMASLRRDRSSRPACLEGESHVISLTTTLVLDSSIQFFSATMSQVQSQGFSCRSIWMKAESWSSTRSTGRWEKWLFRRLSRVSMVPPNTLSGSERSRLLLRNSSCRLCRSLNVCGRISLMMLYSRYRYCSDCRPMKSEWDSDSICSSSSELYSVKSFLKITCSSLTLCNLRSWQLMFKPLSGFCDVQTHTLGHSIGTGERVWYTMMGPKTCLSLELTRGVGLWRILGGREALGMRVGVITPGWKVAGGGGGGGPPWMLESEGGWTTRSPAFRRGHRSCLMSCVMSLPCSRNGVSHTMSPTNTEMVSSHALRGIRSQVQFHGFSSSWISMMPPMCSRTPANGSVLRRLPRRSRYSKLSRPAKVPEPVEGAGADLLQAVVAQVQGRHVAIMHKLVGVEPGQKVAVEEELGHFVRRRLLMFRTFSRSSHGQRCLQMSPLRLSVRDADRLETPGEVEEEEEEEEEIQHLTWCPRRSSSESPEEDGTAAHIWVLDARCEEEEEDEEEEEE